MDENDVQHLPDVGHLKRKGKNKQMKIYTDNPDFAKRYIANNINFSKAENHYFDSNIAPVIKKIIYPSPVFWTKMKENSGWNHLILTEFSEESQFDSLIELSKNQELPDKILCQAGSGKKFHGFRNRAWKSLPGNLHISAFFAPNRNIPNFSTGFLILAAVSVIQTIDSIPQLKGKARIKWVNDIIIENAKVCGVLAQTQVTGSKVTGAVIGIGLNVETAPLVEPTPFVPKSGCLKGFLQSNISEKQVFDLLIRILNINYTFLLNGKYPELLEYYREKSLILGKNVAIWSDERNGSNKILHQSRVLQIGENLELYIEGVNSPVTKGRLSL